MKDYILINRKIQLAVLLALCSVFGTVTKPACGKTYVLIISGINKDTENKISRYRIITGLQSYLLNNTEVSYETLKVLTSDDVGNNNAKSSQWTNIQKVMSDFESVIKPEDKFIFYYTGQANVVNQQLRFNLPGQDVTQTQLGELIKKINSSSILILLDCPASGLAVKELSSKGRIIICSCTDEQRFSTKFGEYFVSAFSKTETDIDNDGRISILEVFIATSKNVNDWYQKEKLLVTETPVLDDNGDGKASKEPWRYMIDLKDGLEASKYFFQQEQ